MGKQLIILDLDGTCYPRDSALTRIIDDRTTTFLVKRAGVEPADLDAMERRNPSILEALDLLGIPRRQWADAVYQDLPYRRLLHPDPALALALSRIGGPRILVTMAPGRHAIEVLDALGLAAMIDRTISVCDNEFHTDKHEIYRELVADFGATEATVFGDNVALDLDPASALGCVCVHIDPGGGRGGAYPVYPDLARALVAL
ncbi:HAD family hydrolase [Nocardia sp. NPDC087230]|uniref:HAD family hydrolase n=1 Tax=Nocardia sp. NPDC087230 TaxID=3364331 RepID=UPI00381E634B